jgi:hypothetical protein
VKLVMTLLVRNEDDILEANLDYHFARGVDFVIATDNNSEDATPEILERYAKRGLVHVIHEPSDDYSQRQWVTRMARMAATDFGADWVINNDADEFWWPRAASLKEIFAAVPQEFGVVVAPRLNFVARPGESGAFFDRMTVAEVRGVPTLPEWRRFKEGDEAVRGSGRLNWYPHFLLPKTAHRATADAEVANGNHSVQGTGLRPLPGWQPIEVLHFPLRSYAHFEKKVIDGGRATERNPDPTYNGHLRQQYRLYQEGRLFEYYRPQVVDDEELEAGVAEGRLLVDRRLQRFFADGSGGTEGAAPQAADTDGLRAEMLRALTQGEWAELETQGLYEKRRRVEERLERERERRQEADARLKRTKAKLEQVERDLAAIERRPAQRLRRSLAALMANRSSHAGRE